MFGGYTIELSCILLSSYLFVSMSPQVRNPWYFKSVKPHLNALCMFLMHHKSHSLIAMSVANETPQSR